MWYQIIATFLAILVTGFVGFGLEPEAGPTRVNTVFQIMCFVFLVIFVLLVTREDAGSVRDSYEP